MHEPGARAGFAVYKGIEIGFIVVGLRWPCESGAAPFLARVGLGMLLQGALMRRRPTCWPNIAPTRT